MLGGLVTATTIGTSAVAHRLPLDPGLCFVLLVPSRRLPTSEARAALAPRVPHRDAAFNLGRMGLLLAGLADRRLLRREATEDRLHQPARAFLFPEAAALIDGLADAGALAACWSGAGPSMLAMCDAAEAEGVRAAGEELKAAAKVGGTALLLQADHEGLTVLH